MNDIAKQDIRFCKDMLEFYNDYYAHCKGRRPCIDAIILIRIKEFEKLLQDHYRVLQMYALSNIMALEV